MTNRRLRKELLETARGLYDLGTIDGKTMRELESLRVEAPKAYTAHESLLTSVFFIAFALVQLPFGAGIFARAFNV